MKSRRKVGQGVLLGRRISQSHRKQRIVWMIKECGLATSLSSQQTDLNSWGRGQGGGINAQLGILINDKLNP